MSQIIHLPHRELKSARQLLTRLPFTKSKLAVLTHILLQADAERITLAVTTVDHWLETVVAGPDPQRPTLRFLIPAAALAAVLKADPGSTVCLIPRASRGGQELTLRCHRGGMTVDATLPTEDAADFPQRPEVQGSACFLPAATLRAIRQVAPCASTDRSRYVLNSVCLRPEDGGVVIATDGRKLAVVAAQVPAREFILPKDVVHVLGHPDFLIERPGGAGAGAGAGGGGGIPGGTTVTWNEEPRRRGLAFECGRHLLLVRPIEGNYPDYRRAIPADPTSEALLPPSHLSGVISWLKSLLGRGRSVHLSWEQPEQLRLTYRDTDGNTSAMSAHVRVKGAPPAIACAPEHLAAALEIGPTLCLLDEMSPAIARSNSGGFCVVMPMRITPLPAPRHAEAGASAA